MGQTHVFPLGSLDGREVHVLWMEKGAACGVAGSCVLHVVVNYGPGSCVRLTAHESGVVRGVVQGSFWGSLSCVYFQHLFSFVFFVCSFFYP